MLTIPKQELSACLLYTSDAADEEDSVDLGGCDDLYALDGQKKLDNLLAKCGTI